MTQRTYVCFFKPRFRVLWTCIYPFLSCLLALMDKNIVCFVEGCVSVPWISVAHQPHLYKYEKTLKIPYCVLPISLGSQYCGGLLLKMQGNAIHSFWHPPLIWKNTANVWVWKPLGNCLVQISGLLYLRKPGLSEYIEAINYDLVNRLLPQFSVSWD